MDYSVEWLIENEVVQVIQYKEFTLEIGASMVRDASDLMNQSNKSKVPIIVDGSRVPSRMYNIFDAIKMFRDNRSEKWGFTIVIGNSDVVQFVAQAILQVARVELRFAKNMDEALNILYRIDPNLPK